MTDTDRLVALCALHDRSTTQVITDEGESLFPVGLALTESGELRVVVVRHDDITAVHTIPTTGGK
jgi:hypothetical protein